MGTNAVLMILLQPYFMRYQDRMAIIFVKYNPKWKTEKNNIVVVAENYYS